MLCALGQLVGGAIQITVVIVIVIVYISHAKCNDTNDGILLVDDGDEPVQLSPLTAARYTCMSRGAA